MEETVLNKVQKLVDKAFSTTFPAEKDALLAKAESLMLQYSIDSAALLDPSRPNTAAAIKMSTPEVRSVVMYDYDMDYDMALACAGIFSDLASHFQIRKVDWGMNVRLFGYPADLDFFEMMLLSIKIHLVANLDPKADVDRPWYESSTAMKNAGYKWEQIHMAMQVHPGYPYLNRPFSKSIGLAAYAKYKEWHAANPDVPRNTGSPAMWRRSFARGYRDEIYTRLHRMREEASRNNNLPALLADKKSRLDEAFNEMFPPAAPAPITGQVKRGRVARYVAPKIDEAASRAGRQVARTVDLNNPNSRLAPNQKGIS